MQEVYIDILALENFVMDYFILYMTSKLLYTGTVCRPRKLMLRLAVSSGVGVLYTISSILLLRSAFSLFVFKILLSFVMIYVAFCPNTLSQSLKTVGCFYGVSLLTGGTALCVLTLASGSGAGAHGGSVFQWEQPVNYILIVAAVVTVVGDATLKAVRQRRQMSKYGVDLYIQFEEEGIWIPGLVDSGNELKDPWNGSPVVVAELSAVQSALPKEVELFLKEYGTEGFMDSKHLALLDDWAARIRLIPFSSLGCDQGILVGFRANTVRIRPPGEAIIELHNQTVCLCLRTLSGEGKYRALLGNGLLEGAFQTQEAIPA